MRKRRMLEKKINSLDKLFIEQSLELFAYEKIDKKTMMKILHHYERKTASRHDLNQYWTRYYAIKREVYDE